MDRGSRIRIGVAKLLFFGSLLLVAGTIIAFLGVTGALYIGLSRGGGAPDLAADLTVKLLPFAISGFLISGVALTVNTVYRVLSFMLIGERLNFYEKGGVVLALVFLYIAL